MSVATINNHIILNDEGVPTVRGTRTKVVQIVLDAKNGWSAEYIHEQYPYLSLAQIHSALAYYYDHRDEIEEDIARRERLVEEIRRELGPSELRKRVLEQRGSK